MKRVLLFFALVATLGCSDAEVSQITTLGKPAHVKCFSGGRLIYEGTSTGKVSSEEKSDGWYLRDAATGKLVRVSGDCVVVN